jgi:NAD+ synthase (glutamine-hydrolysing)
MAFEYFRVAAASPPVKVADVNFNLRTTKEFFERAAEKNVSLVVFPELGLTAYTCGDLFYDQLLLKCASEAVLDFARGTAGSDSIAVIGFPLPLHGRLFNCAAVICNGEIKGLIPKSYLPNTGEFFERRWFSSGRDRKTGLIDFYGSEVPFGCSQLFTIFNTQLRIGVELCEDLWAIAPPSNELCLAGANLIVNLSASNEIIGKRIYRRQLVAQQSARGICAYVYASAGPGESTTDLVFSGHCLIAENGSILKESDRFNFDGSLIIQDIDVQRLDYERRRNSTFSVVSSLTTFETHLHLKPQEPWPPTELVRTVSPYPFIPKEDSDRNEVCSEIFSIQTAGLRKRLEYTGVKSLVLGLSGGLDSSLALLVATNVFDELKLDPREILCYSLPGFGTSSRTKENAKKLALFSGVALTEIDIKKSVSLHLSEIKYPEKSLGITFENAQARERTQILMDVANKHNALVLGTGDLSEAALGWATYNGDHMSMYHVNVGIPKTLVKYLVEWRAEVGASQLLRDVLLDIIATPISPELLPADDETIQSTEVSIGPYILHDFFLYHMLRGGCNPAKILLLAEIAFKDKFSHTEIKKWLLLFYRRFFVNQFKRSSMPDGPKVGTVALSPRGDWKMPSDASADIWIKELENLS